MRSVIGTAPSMVGPSGIAPGEPLSAAALFPSAHAARAAADAVPPVVKRNSRWVESEDPVVERLAWGLRSSKSAFATRRRVMGSRTAEPEVPACPMKRPLSRLRHRAEDVKLNDLLVLLAYENVPQLFRRNVLPWRHGRPSR